MYNFLLIRWKFRKISSDQLQELANALIITADQKDAITSTPQV